MDSISELSSRIKKFNQERDWEQFHSPSNLAKSISIESAELLECFQWNDIDFDKKNVIEELADVLMYYNDILLCYDISSEELKTAYKEKFERNMKRW